MKRTAKSVCAVLLLCVWLFSGCGASPSAVQDGANDAALAKVAAEHFFEPQPHQDVDFASLAPMSDYDDTAFRARIEALAALMNQNDSWSEIQGQYEWLYSEIQSLQTAYTAQNIALYRSGGETVYSDACDTLHEHLVELGDLFEATLSGLMKTQYAASLTRLAGDYAAEQFAEYEPLTDRQKELLQQESTLVLQYHNIQNKEYTYTYGGKEWSWANMNTEDFGALSRDDRIKLFAGVMNAQNEEHGGLFLQLVKVRRQIAAEFGYDTYTDYCYDLVYQRDYTPAQAAEFHKNVKTLWGPSYAKEIQPLSIVSADIQADDTPFTSDEVLQLLDTYVPRISQELTEPLQYMKKNGLYALMGPEDGALEAGFTTSLDSYNAPFLYDYLYGNKSNISGTVHEFGHYSSTFYFNTPGNELETLDSLDIAEVHSQGLEVLFSALFYDEIYTDEADAMTARLLSGMLSLVIDGCVMDEFQQAVYASKEDLTLDDVNALYADIQAQYGISYGNEYYDSMYWMFIPHNFDSPLYYLSYATSALTALDIWNTAYEDNAAGAREYLNFCSHGSRMGYFALLNACGMDNFTNADYILSLYNSADIWFQSAEKRYVAHKKFSFLPAA